MKGGEKFGMALGKIGDVNGDGFNDLAISAVSNEEGCIYIHFGSEHGLKTKPSQIIKMSHENSMFGFSLSRGVDIDKNGVVDLAVGAPSADKVYIYKSYPVINVHAKLNSSKRQVELKDNLEISACLQIRSKYKLKFDVGE